MASKRSEPTKSRLAPATTSEARELQLAAIAYDVAEKQMLNGEASSQVITHFLKVGSAREQREQRRMELEADLLVAKIEGMESAHRVEELYDEAIKAMRSYGGQTPDYDL